MALEFKLFRRNNLFRRARLAIGDLKRWRHRCIEFACQPVQQLEFHNKFDLGNNGSHNDYDWQAVGDDPSFLLHPTTGLYPRGWYMIEIRLDSNQALHNARFTFITDCTEKNELIVPWVSGKVAKRLCYLSDLPKVIRFDPTDSPCHFSILQLNFVKVSEGFAFNRILRKLQAIHPDYTGYLYNDIKNRIRKKIQGMDLQPFLLMKYGECFQPHRIHYSYKQWITDFEKPEMQDKLKNNLEALTYRPLFSVLLPVYNTEERFLRRCIESVMAQSYPCWELCIADDASSNPLVREVLNEFATEDARIKVTFRKKNGHISEASNSALVLVKGDYVALLDHDDELAEHALLVVAGTLNRHPNAQIIYSDEDKIDADGNRSDPHFKPDWNKELLYSQNYISHLSIYRADLLKKVGGLRVGFEGSQDHDLLLRCLSRIEEDQIIHIPKVLYHWRQVKGSTALDANEKDYTTEAGIRALQEHFKELNIAVKVFQGLAPNSYRVQWPIPELAPLVSLLIPTRNGYGLIRRCVDSIVEKTTYPNYEIIILNNDSNCPKTNKYLKAISAVGNIRVIDYNKTFNYSAINNFGVRYAAGEIIGLLNNDLEVISPDWLSEMASYAVRSDIGCVGAMLYYDNDTIQHAGVITGLGGVAGHSHKYHPKGSAGYMRRLQLVQNLSAVTAACLLVRKSIYEQVGGLNEIDLKIAFNDVDFCLRVSQAGYRNLWTPYAELYHHESASRGTEDTPEKQSRFQQEVAYMKKTWGNVLLLDPAYSPNLTLDREDFSLS